MMGILYYKSWRNPRFQSLLDCQICHCILASRILEAENEAGRVCRGRDGEPGPAGACKPHQPHPSAQARRGARVRRVPSGARSQDTQAMAGACLIGHAEQCGQDTEYHARGVGGHVWFSGRVSGSVDVSEQHISPQTADNER